LNLDGFRALAYIENGKGRLVSRNGNTFTLDPMPIVEQEVLCESGLFNLAADDPGGTGSRLRRGG